jgi:exodeoxyribonuclease VII large subunit
MEGLFDADRKRPIKTMPRGIGVVTSLGAAALHDVASALQRRVPHIPVLLAPTLVQGPDAAPSLVLALQQLIQQPNIDVILLVRGGGSMEDLWAFNDENLARAIVASPIPIISGVGHETDFTITDFCADLRAPTPTAAAEMCAIPQAELLANLQLWGGALQTVAHRQLDTQEQRLDRAQARLGRPSEGLGTEKMQLMRLQQRLQSGLRLHTQRCQNELAMLASGMARGLQQTPSTARERLNRAALRLQLLDPKLVLQRGFAWLSDADGLAITAVAQTKEGQALQATLADGVVDLTVSANRRI